MSNKEFEDCIPRLKEAFEEAKSVTDTDILCEKYPDIDEEVFITMVEALDEDDSVTFEEVLPQIEYICCDSDCEELDEDDDFDDFFDEDVEKESDSF